MPLPLEDVTTKVVSTKKQIPNFKQAPIFKFSKLEFIWNL